MEAKYLGLDSKLLWNSHIKRVLEITIKALMVCRGLIDHTFKHKSINECSNYCVGGPPLARHGEEGGYTVCVQNARLN
jgi:hypothetical protein